MAGMIVTSTLSGAVITRTGRYKAIICTGPVVIAAGFWLLSRMSPSTTMWQAAPRMVLVGVGLGLTMQALVLVVQNAVQRRDLGIATSMAQFSRQIGGTIGVAIMGTLLNQELRDNIVERIPRAALHNARHHLSALGQNGGASKLLDPETLHTLPPVITHAVRGGLSESINDVFRLSIPFAGLALVACLLIPELPLRDRKSMTREEAGRETLIELGQFDADHEPLPPEEQAT
jgi:hypothetical protein